MVGTCRWLLCWKPLMLLSSLRPRNRPIWFEFYTARVAHLASYQFHSWMFPSHSTPTSLVSSAILLLLMVVFQKTFCFWFAGTTAEFLCLRSSTDGELFHNSFCTFLVAIRFCAVLHFLCPKETMIHRLIDNWFYQLEAMTYFFWFIGWRMEEGSCCWIRNADHHCCHGEGPGWEYI